MGSLVGGADISITCAPCSPASMVTVSPSTSRAVADGLVAAMIFISIFYLLLSKCKVTKVERNGKIYFDISEMK